MCLTRGQQFGVWCTCARARVWVCVCVEKGGGGAEIHAEKLTSYPSSKQFCNHTSKFIQYIFDPISTITSILCHILPLRKVSNVFCKWRGLPFPVHHWDLNSLFPDKCPDSKDNHCRFPGSATGKTVAKEPFYFSRLLKCTIAGRLNVIDDIRNSL